MYVAVASPHGADSKEWSKIVVLDLISINDLKKTKQAYKNSYVKFDLDKLFAEKRPGLWSVFWWSFILRIQFWK